MQKKELALQVIERLKKEYPDTGCSLDYDDAWKLLVSVRLAAQCTDARVNVVVQDLYREFPDVDALADADVEEIERMKAEVLRIQGSAECPKCGAKMPEGAVYCSNCGTKMDDMYEEE